MRLKAVNISLLVVTARGGHVGLAVAIRRQLTQCRLSLTGWALCFLASTLQTLLQQCRVMVAMTAQSFTMAHHPTEGGGLLKQSAEVFEKTQRLT
jgi:hypothetical protein